MAARFDRSQFAGLTTTALSVAFAYFLFIYLGSVLDFLLFDPIVQVDIVTPGGDAIFVGAASFDDGMDWGATHHIAPDVDAERDYLGQGLRQTGLVVSHSKFQAAKQRIGQNFNGDPWFSDGDAIILTFSP